MTKSIDSLGGENAGRRFGSARSSRARSTVFKKLRNLDRKITEIDHRMEITGCSFSPYININPPLSALCKKLAHRRMILDLERKETRRLRKALND